MPTSLHDEIVHIPKRIEAGTAYAEEHWPGKLLNIYVSELNMFSVTDCIVGQAADLYTKHFGYYDPVAVALGYATPEHLISIIIDGQKASYWYLRALEEAWKEKIVALRHKA